MALAVDMCLISAAPLRADPIGDRIFATIWDGGGNDTFDLSAYSENLNIDLRPGEMSTFSIDQLARLDSNILSDGSIYNALLYQGDTRSLIENIIGGQGNDTLHGNEVQNEITGGQGNDVMTGDGGADRFIFSGNHGADHITDFDADDVLQFDISGYISMGRLRQMMTDYDGYVEIDFGNGNLVRLDGVQSGELTAAHFNLTGTPEDITAPIQYDRLIKETTSGQNTSKDSDVLVSEHLPDDLAQHLAASSQSPDIDFEMSDAGMLAMMAHLSEGYAVELF